MTVISLTKSTLKTTVKLTRKTKSTLASTFQSTLKLFQRRKALNQRGKLVRWLPRPKKGPQSFDGDCDHLVVLDHARGPDEVVGTYRVLRREHARRTGGFYTASEYDIKKLVGFRGTLMELGRSCVDARYRDRATMQLLWRGIAEYVNAHGVDVMFGCASLPGTDPEQLKTQLSYLYHYHLAPENLRPSALPERFTEMNLLPKEAIDPKRTLASLPPLLKGYLRVGGFVGNGAVIDHQFNTTDVCIIVKTDMIAARYTRHYEIGVQEAQPLRKAS